MTRTYLTIGVSTLLFAAVAQAQQRQPPPPPLAMRNTFMRINKNVLDMAQDFPEAKYGYRPSDGVRSFGEVLVHIMEGDVYAAKAAKDPTAKWDEIDAKNYKTKADIVAALKKSIDDANAAIKAQPDEQFQKTLFPWFAVLEHNAEHYGQLVAYYRANNLVPPASRNQ